MLSAMRLVRFAARGVATPRLYGVRHKSSSAVDTFYRAALKSNVSHVSFVVTGAIIFELIYGKATEAVWDYCNEGVKLENHAIALSFPCFSAETAPPSRLVQIHGALLLRQL